MKVVVPTNLQRIVVLRVFGGARPNEGYVFEWLRSQT